MKLLKTCAYLARGAFARYATRRCVNCVRLFDAATHDRWVVRMPPDALPFGLLSN